MIGIKKLINSLNFNIVKKLKRTQKSIKTFKILIDIKTKNYLIKSYGLNCRYKTMTKVIEDLKLISSRNMSQDSFCCIENNKFQLKFNNNRSANFLTMVNGILEKQTIHEGPSISVKFNVISRGNN